MTKNRVHDAATEKHQQGENTMTDRHKQPRTHWSEIELEVNELDIWSHGTEAFNEMESLWGAILTASGHKKPSMELAQQVANLFASQLADYINGFPEEAHIAVAKHIVHGIFLSCTTPDTDAYDDTTSPSDSE
jgi:hypothetical protein